MEYCYSSKQFAMLMVLGFAMASPYFATAQNGPSEYVAAHNVARAAVGLGPVTWDATVAAYARRYGDTRKGDCKLVHSSGPYGENLFWGSGSGEGWPAADAVNHWAAEKQYYDHAHNSCAPGKACGHYTQIVWRSSTKIGCARVVCDNGKGVFIICSYDPPGNVVGQSPY